MTASDSDESRAGNPDGKGRASPEADLTADEAFTALARHRRRRVLRYLRGLDESRTTLQRLADELDDGDAGAVTASLHHVHLPQLDDLGVVTYSPDTHRIRYHSRPTVERLLDALDE